MTSGARRMGNDTHSLEKPGVIVSVTANASVIAAVGNVDGQASP
jgi:hypothetical protein